MEKNSNKKDTARWEALVRRYFEAETTEAEEIRLRRFLASPEGSDARFDEVRAVMGYLACGKSLEAAAPVGRKPSRRLAPKVWASAAAACLLLAAAPWTVHRLAGERGEVCIAYVGGKKVTSEEAVLRQMHSSLQAVAPQDDLPSVEEQLGDMFDTLDEE